MDEQTNAVSQVNKNDFPFPFELRNHWWEIELLARNGNGPTMRGREPIVSMHKMCAIDKNRQPAAAAGSSPHKQTDLQWPISQIPESFDTRSNEKRTNWERKKNFRIGLVRAFID